jgi:hypothetical protein
MTSGRLRARRETAVRSLRHRLALLHDVDLVIGEFQAPPTHAHLRRLGLEAHGLPKVIAARAKLASQIDPRWMATYERIRARYGRGMVAVRQRVCTGCFVTLPPTARPLESREEPPICQGCGRLLHWA